MNSSTAAFDWWVPRHLLLLSDKQEPGCRDIGPYSSKILFSISSGNIRPEVKKSFLLVSSLQICYKISIILKVGYLMFGYVNQAFHSALER